MDTSKEYILMCERAEEIQNIIFSTTEEYMKWLPLFIYDKEMQRVCISIWTPKTLKIKLRTENPFASISIEQSNDGDIERPEDITQPYQGIAIALPRQDQLQKIYANFLIKRENRSKKPQQKTSFGIAGNFWYAMHKNLGWWKPGWSMEQVWLAFIMKEIYSRPWNGKEWV